MIFNSSQAGSLLTEFSNIPDFLVPESVFLSRSEKCKIERDYLEDCFTKVSSIKRQDWLSRLLSKDDRQHISVWFEIMLLGWLSRTFEVEAMDKDGQPDFSVQAHGKKIMIEARAILISEKKRKEDKFMGGLFAMLKKVKMPFVVEAHRFTIGNAFLSETFVAEVTKWLNDNPNQFYEYQDRYGNKVILSAKCADGFKNVAVTYSPGAFSVNSEPLKRPLKEKATKYHSIRVLC
ncbi:MAG: hypothetical protein AB1564_00250 [Chloroflexota bacterium]